MDRNVVQKEAEKKLKYKTLCIKVQRMWNMKCMFIPVIIAATGIVIEGLRKNLEAMPGKHSADSLQQTAILGSSHITWKVLLYEILSLNGGVQRWFKRRSTREKRPVTRDNNNKNNNKIIIIIMP